MVVVYIKPVTLFAYLLTSYVWHVCSRHYSVGLLALDLQGLLLTVSTPARDLPLLEQLSHHGRDLYGRDLYGHDLYGHDQSGQCRH